MNTETNERRIPRGWLEPDLMHVYNWEQMFRVSGHPKGMSGNFDCQTYDHTISSSKHYDDKRFRPHAARAQESLRPPFHLTSSPYLPRSGTQINKEIFG